MVSGTQVWVDPWLLSILAGLTNPLFDLEGEDDPLYEEEAVEDLIEGLRGVSIEDNMEG